MHTHIYIYICIMLINLCFFLKIQEMDKDIQSFLLHYYRNSMKKNKDASTQTYSESGNLNLNLKEEKKKVI